MADLKLPLYNRDIEEVGIPEKAQLLRDQFTAADAAAIFTAEYNQSMSGVLKTALDLGSRAGGNPWDNKPVAIMSAAVGRARAHRLALNPFRPKLLTGQEVMLAVPSDEFDAEGRLTGRLCSDALSKLMRKLATECCCNASIAAELVCTVPMQTFQIAYSTTAVFAQ